MEIRTLEWLSQHRPERLKLSKRPGYMEMIWMTEGEGTCVVDLDKWHIAESEVYCIGTKQLRQFDIDGQVKGYYL